MVRPCQVVFHLICEDSSCRNECKVSKKGCILLLSILKVCGVVNISTTALLSKPTQKLTCKNLNVFPILWSLSFILVIIVEDITTLRLVSTNGSYIISFLL